MHDLTQALPAASHARADPNRSGSDGDRPLRLSRSAGIPHDSNPVSDVLGGRRFAGAHDALDNHQLWPDIGQWRDHRDAGGQASRSSAPCRMKIAACSSITQGAPGAAHVGPDQIALHGDGGEPLVPQRDGELGEFEKLRAKARVDCARGPSLASMLMGRPSTKPTALRSPAMASRRAASALKALRWMVSTPVASSAVGVGHRDTDGLGARDRGPQSAPRSGQCATASISGRMRAGMAPHNTRVAGHAKRERLDDNGPADIIRFVRRHRHAAGATRWRIAAIGSSSHSRAPARGFGFTDFCKAPGRSGWSRLFGRGRAVALELSGGRPTPSACSKSSSMAATA